MGAILEVEDLRVNFGENEAVRGVSFDIQQGETVALVGESGTPGWATMTAGDGRSGAELDDDYRRRGVATFEELIEACSALGARLMVCEMGLRAMGLTREDLRDDLNIAEGGLVTFFSDAGDSPITFL